MATKTIYGNVNGQGIKTSGQGFHSRRQSKGTFVIDFDQPYSDIPAIVGTQTQLGTLKQNTRDNVVFPIVTRRYATAKVGDGNGNPIDFPFSFIAIGEE